MTQPTDPRPASPVGGGYSDETNANLAELLRQAARDLHPYSLGEIDSPSLNVALPAYLNEAAVRLTALSPSVTGEADGKLTFRSKEHLADAVLGGLYDWPMKSDAPVDLVRLWAEGVAEDAALSPTALEQGSGSFPAKEPVIPTEREDGAVVDGLLSALEFYADPESYHAVAIFADRPAGAFADDFSGDHGHADYDREMPGKLAREALDAFMASNPSKVAKLIEDAEAAHAAEAFFRPGMGFDGPHEQDTPLQAAAREAGWALMSNVDAFPWERRQQVSDICHRLAVSVDDLAAPVSGQEATSLTTTPSGGGKPVTIIFSQVSSFNSYRCNDDERRVVMKGGETYRLRLSDAETILAAIGATS